MLKVRCRSTEHLYEVMQEIQTWAGVARTHSAIALRTTKETVAVPLDAVP